MEEQRFILSVSEENDNLRIDKFIAENMDELSRTHIQKLIKDGMITISGKAVKPNYKLSRGEAVTVFIPEPEEVDILPENIPLDILYEDEDIILVNKSKGMVVHPSAGHYTGTLVNALMFHCKDRLSGINGALRPGIVHRIDMNTTGVIVACKNDRAHMYIAEQLKEHTITRKYNAIVYHGFKEEIGKIDAPIGRHPTDRKKMAINYQNGKSAVTHYKVLDKLNGKYAYIECTLETGRTHQIRVHMASIHHPLLGDDVYSAMKNPFHLEGQALHARVLGFIHPATKKYVEFEAPLPDYFVELQNKLRFTLTAK